MERVKLPPGEETEKDVVPAAAMGDALAALRKAKNWRDLAIVELLYDTGMRVGECSRAVQDDLDFEARTLRLRAATTKGKRERVVALSDRCIADLDRYLRKRTDSHPELFVGRQGPLTRAGIYRVVRLAFPNLAATISPHDIRHTSATHISGHISEANMMTLMGWKNSKEARHYSRQAAQQNAIEAHRKASPLEKLQK
jgi:integrase/recombinase XerC